ncbi:hypothetical protein MKEN_01074000 [Mycena kentingensis (nom. inval.)]|nr:hypothetical protein MKEN_01074000 [Mycena kentingensis (nom. inval.)]
MSLSTTHHDSAPATTLPHDSARTTTLQTYTRLLGPNELSYFLPSRANGLNDIFTRVMFRAPPSMVTPFRLQCVWAIVRTQHSTLSSRIEMPPGRYNEAAFSYTPPASPKDAFEEAARALTICDDKTGVQLDDHFVHGPRELSATCLSRMYVARCNDGASDGKILVNMAFSSLHTITDGTSANIYTILQYLGGPVRPDGSVRTDEQLFAILQAEWRKRWGSSEATEALDAITPSAESRLPFPTSQFQVAAWRIDSLNFHRKAIGGHTFPRLPSIGNTTRQAMLEIKFSGAQTLALVSKCASEGVNLANAVFALCNMAWLRTAASRGPEFVANLRRHLAPVAPLTSPMALALGYGTVVLPGFLPSGHQAHLKSAFWHRAKSVKTQMNKQLKSPMFLPRAQVLAVERGRRSKAFAKMDDEGIEGPPPPPANSPTNSAAPSIALMGISHLGDLGTSYQPDSYPALEFVDSVGHSRKAPGGILLFTRVAAGQCFSMMLEWDAAAFPKGLVEDFWAFVEQGFKDFVLEEGEAIGAKL